MTFIYIAIYPVLAKPMLAGVGVDIAGVFQGYTGSKGPLKTVVGREERIILKIFECMNTEIDIKLAPFGRHMSMFNSSKDIDVVTTVYGQNKLVGFETHSHITFNNGVSYLAEKFGQSIQSLNDLKGKRVISFVGATKMFPELEIIIPAFKSYSEISNQEIHSKMLFNDRVDAVISDAVIFAHHTAELQRENQKLYRKPVKFQQVFKPTPFYLVFKSKMYRDKFNGCLSKLNSLQILDRLNIEYYNEVIINK